MATKIQLSESLQKTISLEQRALADGGTLVNRNNTVNSIPYNILRLKPKLVLTPSAYRQGIIYSIIPNGVSGDFNFVQNTTNSWRFNENGKLENLPINTNRIDWLYGSPIISIGQQRTSICNFSEPQNGTQITVNVNFTFINYNWDIGFTEAVYAPDNTVDRIIYFSNTGGIAGNFYTMNIFVEMDDGSEPMMRGVDSSNFDLDNRVSGSRSPGTKFQIPGTNIWRFTLIREAIVNSNSFGIIKNDVDSPIGFKIFGCNIFEGQFPQEDQSYIYSSGGPETVDADIATVTPPAGVTEIREYFSNGTFNSTTTIPATYQIPVGEWSKIVML